MERSKTNNISVICGIIFACLIGEAVSAQVDNQNSTTENSSTTINEFSTDFFVFTAQDKILTRPYFSKNAPLSEIKIADSPNFTRDSTEDDYNTEFISDCSDKRIYIFKKSKNNDNQYLDVIQYDDSKKFTRINRVSEMFNEAKSASLDWTTGNIYWIEHDERAYRYSIKFTNKLFEEPKYILQPARMSMAKIQVYPKRKEIFISDNTNIWYTSTLPNSTAKLLFSSTDDTGDLFGIFDFGIDYAHDRLWWNDDVTLYSVDISGSTRPLNVQQIKSQEFNSSASDLLVFNNTFYWLADGENEFETHLYMKNGNDEPEIVAFDVEKSKLSVFSLNCS